MSIRVITIVVTVTLWATSSFAQSRTTVSLAVPDLPRWDAAGYAGWVGLNKSNIAPAWDDWSNAASFGASGGYYWTPHTKLELQYATTTWGDVSAQQTFDGSLFRFGQHRSRSDNLTAAFHYQFSENTWFHPFAAAGIAGTRESNRLELTEQRTCPPAPCIPVQLPREESVSYRVRPFVGTGFKWYVAEQTFIRSDIRFVLAASGLDSVQWHTGLGLDF